MTMGKMHTHSSCISSSLPSPPSSPSSSQSQDAHPLVLQTDKIARTTLICGERPCLQPASDLIILTTVLIMWITCKRPNLWNTECPSSTSWPTAALWATMLSELDLLGWERSYDDCSLRTLTCCESIPPFLETYFCLLLLIPPPPRLLLAKIPDIPKILLQ